MVSPARLAAVRLRPGAAPDAVVRVDVRSTDAGRSLWRAGAGATRLSAGRGVSHRVRARTDRLDVAHGLYDYGGGRCGGTHLAHEGGTRGGGQLCSDRRLVHFRGARDRIALRRTHVGHVVAVGPASHLRAHPALSVSR